MADSAAGGGAPGDLDDAGLLPEPVRARALALAADALGQIPAEQLPAPLRRVATFAPVRRARLAATQIATALQGDTAFRERVATQVRAAVPELAGALDEQQPPPAANPVETAAVAYLLQVPGWQAFAQAAREAREEQAGVGADRSDAVQRLQRKLRDARGEVRAARDKAQDQVAKVKQENADLRRRLAQTRQRLEAADRERREATDAHAAAQKEVAGLEAEARRLRARIGELEAAGSAARRSAREEREATTVRTRLLLDTLLDSIQGLRRELALPPTSGSPADAVGGAMSPEGGTPGTAGAGMALAPDDPSLLEELLVLPRVHVLIDGYNVTKTAWSTTPLESQRTRLLTGLAPVVARCRAEVTVVFDGADLAAPPPVSGPRGVRVLFSPPGVTADEVLRDLLTAEPAGRPLVVVSSDREVAASAQRSGARAVQSAALVRLLART